MCIFRSNKVEYSFNRITGHYAPGILPKDQKYNLHYDDVRGDVRRSPHSTTGNVCKQVILVLRFLELLRFVKLIFIIYVLNFIFKLKYSSCQFSNSVDHWRVTEFSDL